MPTAVCQAVGPRTSTPRIRLDKGTLSDRGKNNRSVAAVSPSTLLCLLQLGETQYKNDLHRLGELNIH